MKQKSKRKIRACQKCHHRQYYRKTTDDWRCDKCGLISSNKYKFSLIPTDKIPERTERKWGWVKIIKDFVKSGEKYSYIQFDSKEEMKGAYAGLHSTGRTHHVKISQFTHLLRIYLEKL